MGMLFVLVGLLIGTVIIVAIGDRVGLPWPALLVIPATAAVFVPGIPAVEIPADLILPIFLPPLLWALARRTSWGVIREQWRTIVSLSVLLVVATAFAVGTAAYFLLAGFGVAAAIVLGAAIAPPDPVAVDAVAEPAGIPRRIITVLQTEGLFNDAASIVLFHLALYTITHGDDVTIAQGIGNFFYSSIIAGLLGLAIGRLAAWFINHVHDVTARNALTWVVPFAAYIIAEELGASGVIAVVIAAVELNSRAVVEAEDRLSGRSFWETVEMLFTGVAFGLIGLSANNALAVVGTDFWHSVLVGIVLSLVAFAVRFAWMSVFMWVNLRRGHVTGAPLRWQEVLLMTWSGMRGLVTLALVLSIPNGVVGNYHELPVIALTVLFMTMLLPGVALPWLMSVLDVSSQAKGAQDKMRKEVTDKARHAAMQAVREQAKELPPETVAAMQEWFDDRLGTDAEDHENAAERQERMAEMRKRIGLTRRQAVQAAQEELLYLRRQRRYNPAIVDEVLEEFDRLAVVGDINWRK